MVKHFKLTEKSDHDIYSPVVHGDHPNQEYQSLLVDPLSHYSHPLLEDPAHRLLQGGPEQCRTVMVVTYNM